jgi:hypothetical protein
MGKKSPAEPVDQETSHPLHCPKCAENPFPAKAAASSKISSRILGPSTIWSRSCPLSRMGSCAHSASPREPVSLLPRVPPIADLVPGYEASSWNAILVPTNTPKENRRPAQCRDQPYPGEARHRRKAARLRSGRAPRQESVRAPPPSRRPQQAHRAAPSQPRRRSCLASDTRHPRHATFASGRAMRWRLLRPTPYDLPPPHHGGSPTHVFGFLCLW